MYKVQVKDQFGQWTTHRYEKPDGPLSQYDTLQEAVVALTNLWAISNLDFGNFRIAATSGGVEGKILNSYYLSLSKY